MPCCSDWSIEKSVLVRMTGCPNGCARPYMAEIGLVGSGVEQYQLWLGGSPNLTRLAQPYLERMPLEDLEATLEPLLLAWRQRGLRGASVISSSRWPRRGAAAAGRGSWVKPPAHPLRP